MTQYHDRLEAGEFSANKKTRDAAIKAKNAQPAAAADEPKSEEPKNDKA